MFVPRGMWHDTETVDAASLHFNIQSGQVRWADVLAFILDCTTVLHGEPFREAVGAILTRGTEEEIDAATRERVRALFGELEETFLSIDRPALYRFVASRRGA